MPRKKSVDIGCLNIVSHPHSPEIYVQLFEAANKGASRPLAEHQYCRIRHVRAINNKNPLFGIKGKIFKHLQLTTEDEWLDDRTDDVAAETDVADIIPDHLLPGLVQFDFVFYPQGHRLFFAMKNEKGKSLSPRTAQKIVYATLTELEVTKKEGLDINVHVESSHEGLEQIFSLKSIQSIEFEVDLPNPDENNKAQAKYKKRLEKQNIKKKKTTLTASRGKSLTPDEGTKTELNVAASNGYVTGKGTQADGTKEEISTKEHPFKEKESYDQRWTIPEVLVAKAPTFLKGILARFD